MDSGELTDSLRITLSRRQLAFVSRWAKRWGMDLDRALMKVVMEQVSAIEHEGSYADAAE